MMMEISGVGLKPVRIAKVVVVTKIVVILTQILKFHVMEIN